MKKNSYRNSNVWWPVKLMHVGKQYYIMTKLSYLKNPKQILFHIIVTIMC